MRYNVRRPSGSLYAEWAHLYQAAGARQPTEIVAGVVVMNGFNTYQETAVSTQSRGRLIVMLYDGAIRFLRQAIADIERSDHTAKGRHIGKAQDIIFELNTVLDMQQGGQIAQNLRSLYNFMHKHLAEANIRKDPQMIREVIAILEELNQSWRAITS